MPALPVVAVTALTLVLAYRCRRAAVDRAWINGYAHGRTDAAA